MLTLVKALHAATILFELTNQFFQYTREEIEWYGLTFGEACSKWKKENLSTKKTEPLKIELRAKLIEELKAGRGGELPKIEEAETSLLSKIKSFNPFSSSSKTD